MHLHEQSCNLKITYHDHINICKKYEIQASFHFLLITMIAEKNKNKYLKKQVTFVSENIKFLFIYIHLIIH